MTAGKLGSTVEARAATEVGLPEAVVKEPEELLASYDLAPAQIEALRELLKEPTPDHRDIARDFCKSY